MSNVDWNKPIELVTRAGVFPAFLLYNNWHWYALSCQTLTHCVRTSRNGFDLIEFFNKDGTKGDNSPLFIRNSSSPEGGEK